MLSMTQTDDPPAPITDDRADIADSSHSCDSCRSTTSKPDCLYKILVIGLFAVAIWLLAMPWVPAIARCTMNRFHLQTRSFGAWALQQPIPPMYSFANTTEVRSEGKKVLASRTLNHFPTREFTFASARARHLLDRSSKWFVLHSAYRGQAIQSIYQLDPADLGGWKVTLVKNGESVEEDD